jgi:pSer/pThr/pTyr-binding forkhead associated (FHA) protein
VHAKGVVVDVTDDPRLRWVDAEGLQHELALSPLSPRVTVGRSPHADLALTWDEEVSRLHATVEWIGTHWTITDDGLSRNGTFLNGERISGRRRLRAGDSIRVGASQLSFRGTSGLSGSATRVATEVPSLRSLTETQLKVLMALCRPYGRNATFATPASNQQIADELYLSVDAIKTHLRVLFTKFGVEDLPQNQKRVRLVERAMNSGVVNQRDLSSPAG